MTAVIVAGFHRSGTSVAARALAESGLFLGDDLLGSEPSNPHGHFEDLDIIDIHQTLLELNGVDWKADATFDPYVPDHIWSRMSTLVHKREATGRHWGFKDPRVCLFLPLWMHLLPDAKLIVVFRNPAETVRSLHMRHSRQMAHMRGPGEVHQDFWRRPDLGVQMWVTYHEALLASLPPLDRVHVVNFGQRQSIAEVASVVDGLWDLGLEPHHADVLDPELGETSVDPVEVRDSDLIERVDAIWQVLIGLADQSARRPTRARVG